MDSPVAFTILVIEDEYFIAEELEQALRQKGARILGPVGTINEAEALLAEEHPALVILDVNLHGQMTFSFADKLASSAIPFVFATGYEPSVIPERFRDVPCWEKPFEVGQLVRSLRF